MKRRSIIQTRNRMFIHYYWVSLVLHLTIGMLFNMEFPLVMVVTGAVTLAVLFGQWRLKANEKIIQYTLLLSLNLYVFSAVYDAYNPTALVFYIVPIFLASLYFDILPVVMLVLLTGAELFLFSPISPLRPNPDSDPVSVLVLVVLMSFITLITLIHSHFSGKVLNILEEKNEAMERALLSKEGYLQLFFENARDAIAVFDLNNHVIDINPAFEELYGWSRNEIIGKPVPMIPPENREAAEKRQQAVLAGNSYSQFETTDIRRDGSRFDAQLTLSPIFDHTGKVIATSVISRDISYQKEAERLIVQSEKLKLAGEIAAGVAHEIRNPMTVVSGFVQMMHHDPNHAYQGYTKLILSELERINLIISEFLVLSKPQAVAFQPLSLRDTLQDVLILYGPEMRMQDIDFTETWEQEDFCLVGEENQLKQVFINLLKNAIEASGVGGRISLLAEGADDGTVAVRLRDNGDGIPEEVMDRIFEPFFTTKASGTGLGLMVSQKIVREHGGTLNIRSEEGKGTEVALFLPLLQKEKTGR